MSHPENVRKLHPWHTGFDRVMKRSVFITFELDISCDPSISSVFIRDDLPWHTACVLLELLLTVADLS